MCLIFFVFKVGDLELGDFERGDFEEGDTERGDVRGDLELFLVL